MGCYSKEEKVGFACAGGKIVGITLFIAGLSVKSFPLFLTGAVIFLVASLDWDKEKRTANIVALLVMLLMFTLVGLSGFFFGAGGALLALVILLFLCSLIVFGAKGTLIVLSLWGISN